jgi:hypothetical protein
MVAMDINSYFTAILFITRYSIFKVICLNTKMKGNGDTLSFTTNCKVSKGNEMVEKGGNLLVRMHLPVDARDV